MDAHVCGCSSKGKGTRLGGPSLQTHCVLGRPQRTGLGASYPPARVAVPGAGRECFQGLVSPCPRGAGLSPETLEGLAGPRRGDPRQRKRLPARLLRGTDRGLVSGTAPLKVRSVDQQCLGTRQKCKFSGSTPDLLNQNFWVGGSRPVCLTSPPGEFENPWSRGE